MNVRNSGLKRGKRCRERDIARNRSFGPAILEPDHNWLNGRPRPHHPAPLDLGVEDVAVELPLAVDLLQHEDLSVAFTAFGFLALGHYRRITALLRDAGWRVNHKRVERIWRREGLKVTEEAAEERETVVERRLVHQAKA